MEQRTKSYLRLIKPGITISNTMSGAAGFFLAASIVTFSITAFIGAIFGIAFIIASACVANNVLDRDLDKRMKRTAKRDVATGTISIPRALAFSLVLAIAGFTLLAVWTNPLTVLLGATAFIWYVAIYGIAKRTTAYSTIIGGVAGALPPAAGYTALTGRVDAAAIILFLILFFWQLPHFYAISMFRRDDYKEAGLPVWAVRYGMESTKVQILMSVILYAVVASLLFFYGYVGAIYLVISSALSIYWVYRGVVLYKKVDDVKWARTMFGISLMVLLAMCALIAVGGYLP